MNHKERILAAIRHEPVDCFPTDIWATPEVWKKLCDYFQTNQRIDVYDRLDIDGIMEISPDYIGPVLKTEHGIRYNEWGMGYRVQGYGSGEYEEQVVFPLAEAKTIDDLEKFIWPSPDWYQYNTLPAKAAQFSGRAIGCGYTAIFFWHNQMRGLEQSLVDTLENPEISEYLIRKVSDFFTEYHTRCFEALKGKMDITQVTDDYGAQNGLLISPRVFDRFYRQPMQRAIDLAKSYDVIVFHHDDGDCRPLLPRLVDMGIQILNPVQWRCGDWNLQELKDQFGKKICFHSAVDNQQTLPFGTPEDVRKEVRHIKQTLGCDGTGLIVGPCHNLQPNTRIENILALFETAKE